jgi:hypothetical protein
MNHDAYVDLVRAVLAGAPAPDRPALFRRLFPKTWALLAVNRNLATVESLFRARAEARDQDPGR